jgi:transcriptional regulator NrdR family protein
LKSKINNRKSKIQRRGHGGSTRMTAPFQPLPPTWVRKRDGRLVPFEADRISRALFAAGESCGRADAFLARELADVVVHFLIDEADGQPVPSEQIAEIVVKVLRELKQHELALAFAEHARTRVRRPQEDEEGRETAAGCVYHFSSKDSPQAILDDCTRTYTLQVVFTRDLAAAHADGLIDLGGLEAPSELAGGLLVPPAGEGGKGRANGRDRSGPWPRLLEDLASFPGRVVILEGPEHGLARTVAQRPRRGATVLAERAAAEFLEELSLGLCLTGRSAVLNVNSSSPPPWADDGSAGPLFADQGGAADVDWVADLAAAVAEEALLPNPRYARIRVDWHLAERDFVPPGRERLLRLAHAALVGGAVTFVLDRPRRPLSLGEGVQRRHPAVLLSVGLNLARLAALVLDEPVLPIVEDGGENLPRVQARFLERLKSLARLALSAALQKRDFLRQHSRAHPALSRGFLLERARLLVAPLGLDRAVQTLLGHGICSGEAGVALGRAILCNLLDVLREEGRASALEVCIDAPPAMSGLPDPLPTGESASLASPPAGVVSPTGWDPAAPVKAQMMALGELHAAAEGGTGVVFLPADPLATPEQVADWLRWAWKETEAVRLRLVQALPRQRQLTLPVAEQG